MRNLILLSVLFLSIIAGAVPGETVRYSLPNWIEFEMVEVGGTSKIPIQFLFDGTEPNLYNDVESPKYWIGKFEVTQKQYEEVMKVNPSKIKGDRLPVTDVRWIDAVKFCDLLNHVCQGKIPDGYRFDLPTLMEWAHAFSAGSTNIYRYAGSDMLNAVAWYGSSRKNGVVDYSSLHFGGLKLPNAIGVYDMSGNVAEFVFLADDHNGSVRMGGSFMWPERFCEITGVAHVEKEGKAPDLGFRVALVPIAGYDPNGQTRAMGTKGRILSELGYPAMARNYLATAMSMQGLSDEERKALNDEWLKADKAYGYEWGDWHTLMKRLTEKMETSNCLARDVLAFWEASPADGWYEAVRKTTQKLYREHRIYGMKLAVEELPKDIGKHFKQKSKAKVQIVTCDFTGDGLMDLIVEMPEGADLSGECYGFFARKKKGGYALIGEPLRTVGLSIVPTKAKGILMLALVKRGDQALAPSVLDCSERNGQVHMRVACPFDRSFCLKELADGAVHAHVPFMGESNAARQKNLNEGTYTRPLCWPW